MRYEKKNRMEKEKWNFSLINPDEMFCHSSVSFTLPFIVYKHYDETFNICFNVYIEK